MSGHECSCGGACGCNNETADVQRVYLTREEYVARLEEYLTQLKAEIVSVEEELTSLKQAAAG